MNHNSSKMAKKLTLANYTLHISCEYYSQKLALPIQ